MAYLATAEATFVGDKVGFFRRGELGGSRRVVSVGALRQIVDLGSQVVDGDVEVVNVHVTGALFGSRRDSWPMGEKDGVDEGGRGNGLFQGGALPEFDLLAGVGLEALDEPVKGCTRVQGRYAAKEAPELVGIQGD